MITSCYQVAFVLESTTTATPVIKFRERPCIPLEAVNLLKEGTYNSVKVVCADETIFECYKDGTIQEILVSGEKTIFPARPSPATYLDGSYRLAYFFQGYLDFQNHLRGNYFEFHANGTTIYRCNGITCIWSTEFPAHQIEGTVSVITSDIDECVPEDYWRYERRDSYS